MVPLTPVGIVTALVGGGLIGLAATLYLLTQGRIAGVAGILGRVLEGQRSGLGARLAFLGGLLLAGAAFRMFGAHVFGTTSPRVGLAIVAGLLVGFGTRLANGCTSGHGVCGISRFSTRSLVATMTFIATGAAGVWLLRLG